MISARSLGFLATALAGNSFGCLLSAYFSEQFFFAGQYSLKKILAYNVAWGYELRTGMSVTVIKEQAVFLVTVIAFTFNQLRNLFESLFA